jgi:hypothetical protein
MKPNRHPQAQRLFAQQCGGTLVSKEVFGISPRSLESDYM